MTDLKALSRIYSTARNIYSIRYIIFNIATALVYYLLFNYLLQVQQHGVSIVTVPIYLIYLVIITASILFTIAVYSVKNTINNEAKISGSFLGTVTAILSAIVGGCGCEAPLLFSLTAFGFSTTQTFDLVNFISANQSGIFSAMIAINFFVILYYLDKLSRPSCRIRKIHKKR